MRTVFFAVLPAVALLVAVGATGEAVWGAGQDAKEAPKEAPKNDARETTLAERTRTKLLKTRVTGSFQDVRLGDILKEFADQVDMKGDDPVMWAYGMGFPFAQKVTFSCKDKPLDAVLDGLLTKAGGGLGYVIVSRDGDKYDGWVRLTTTGERGVEKGAEPPPSAEDETSAADKLALAKKLIDGGKPASAKPLLELLVRKYPTTKAGGEAKKLLAEMEK